MTEPNYEAIGRCKVLKADIEQLKTERNAAITSLKQRLHGLTEAIPGTIYTFDAEAAHQQLKHIEDTSRTLLEAANEYNRWATAAGEKPIAIHTPHNH